ncbi:MAG TPA: hypothetical protein VNB59_04900 [Solirubrobacterales bacterium]|nr:hypothetical protein [Solirubrobacterales bacterium]
MNKIKLLGLAAVAVAALMATVGAGTAAATPTSLCKAPTTPNGLPICEGFHLYPAGTNIHAVLEAGTKLSIATPGGVVECKMATLNAFTEQQTAMPLGANVNALTFNACEDEGEPVDVEAVKPGTLDIEIIDIPVWTHNGTLTLTGTEIKVLWTFSGAECFYDPAHTGVLTGGPMATIDWSGTLTKTKGNLLCPEGNATWNGAFTVTSPEPLWVSM